MARPKTTVRPPGVSGSETAAAAKLIGQPVALLPERDPTPAERIALLQRRLKVAATTPAINPYQADFHKFLTELCWTRDEARGGNVAQIPAYPYMKELADALIECPLLFIEKSRRVLASWVVCCYDVWIAAGGQDPRWPQLGNADGNRQVFVASRKFDSSAWFMKRRVQFIVEEFEKHGGRDRWPGFPTWTWKEGEGAASNGSVISAVAQGSDQLRGQGSTLVHCEEVAFWEQAQQTIEGLLPTTQGGGHVVCVTTPNAASYAKKIVDGSLSQVGWR